MASNVRGPFEESKRIASVAGLVSQVLLRSSRDLLQVFVEFIQGLPGQSFAGDLAKRFGKCGITLDGSAELTVTLKNRDAPVPFCVPSARVNNVVSIRTSPGVFVKMFTTAAIRRTRCSAALLTVRESVFEPNSGIARCHSPASLTTRAVKTRPILTRSASSPPRRHHHPNLIVSRAQRTPAQRLRPARIEV